VLSKWDSKKRIAAFIGIFGIVVEIIAIFLMASKRLSPAAASPLLIAGMFIAFVPIFFLARQRKR
jgi:hypothetical protein